MTIFDSLSGLLEMELTSAEPEQALTEINNRGIALVSVRKISDLTLRFTIQRRDYPALTAISEKRGEKLTVCSRKGLYWTGKRLKKRPVLIIGILLLAAAVWFLPTRVLFIQVSGNETVPTRLILAAAEESGIRFGASRALVRSEKVKNTLLALVPQLQWAGVNTAGCVATISVRERAEVPQAEESAGVSSIVASRDGVILSCTATKGNLLCREGQAVNAGQVLISGYTDCGICIQATRAEGEIFAQTRHLFDAVTPDSCQVVSGETETVRRYSILIGKKRINLWKDSGIWDSSCGRMYKEYYITLPGGFALPAALCVDTFLIGQTQNAQLDAEQMQSSLSRFADNYLRDTMVAGSILEKDVSFSQSGGCFRLSGVYVCTEMIGKVRGEEIGETNG